MSDQKQASRQESQKKISFVHALQLSLGIIKIIGSNTRTAGGHNSARFLPYCSPTIAAGCRLLTSPNCNNNDSCIILKQPENLTTSGKSDVMIGNLCDRQTEEARALSPSRLKRGADRATGKCACCRSGKGAISRTPAPALIIGFVLAWIFVLIPASPAQDSPPTEYQIKAAFLFHFAQFVEWPPQAFGGSNAPMIIGILGKNNFGDTLERTIRNKTVNNHPFQLKELHSVREATNCEILFISSSEKKQVPRILENLAGAPVLTVSEMDHFTDSGGIINFVIQNEEVHFQINNDAAKKAGLRISSKLLTLAVR